MISANHLSSPSVWSGSVLERARINWNFGRFMTSASSASKAGLLIRVSVPPRTCSISACGLPRQNKPDSSTLVSTTARTSPALGTNGFYLPIDLFHRHRLDTGFGYALGDREKRVSRLPPPDSIGEQPFERLGCQEPRLARGSRCRVRQLDLNLRHAPSGGIDRTPHR
jgi:hypothetical protein